ncbi:MAG: hypothetical protein FJ278_02460 [Planctomycetes bacterium]|nr:hypothetical protein [Planctomycetota bacterium]
MRQLLAPALATWLASTASAAPDGWLDVHECGASGSEFSTTAQTIAGSKEITVADVGDFRAGQGVTVSKCNPHYTFCTLRPPENPFSTNPLGDAAELRGFDGSAGSWLVFLLEVDGANPLTFRWSDDLTRTWKGTRVPITFDWQPLSGGVEIKVNKRDLQPGHIIAFAARDQLVTKVEAVAGNALTLAHPATRTAKDAVVRHCDDEALQAAITRAVQEKRRVLIPAGRYRLTKSLVVTNAASIVIEGASGANTLLDISEGHGGCIRLQGGTEAVIRNLRMVGHTGLGEGPGWRSFRTSSGRACWPVGLKPCHAISIRNTERVLIENVHASRMNCEAFYCQGDARSGTREPKAYTKSLTYLRCSATDCDGNAFNNNDLAENTSVLYCRIVDVGGCSWEGASRFVRFIGNYLRNAGPVAMGNIGSRAAHLEELGSGQHIVADNVFEGRCFYAGRAGRPMVTTAAAVQVIITNNLFVNFNSTGVALRNVSSDRMLPAEIATVRGNIFDMTCQDPEPIARTCIDVGTTGVLVSDNQIYVRGGPDPTVTAIKLREPALGLTIHDNLIRNCGIGLVTARADASVSKVVAPATFLLTGAAVPLERRQSHRYRGWNLAWTSGSQANTLAIIDSFDPETLRFTLKEPRDLKAGDRFEVFPPSANWNIHHNTITGCLSPVVLDSYGSETSFFKDNVVTRGEATGVKAAIEVRGRFHLIGNHISGFGEKDSAALALFADPLGRLGQNLYRANIIERCAVPITESQKGLWDAAKAQENVIIEQR